MVATVRLDKNLEDTLDKVAKMLHKKKSDVIRDAISFYAQNIESDKKNRMIKAVKKTKDTDKKEFEEFVGTLDDGV